jgi:hypothetical protein
MLGTHLVVQEIGEVLLKLDLEPKGITYGRIAKIIAVYIKTVYISAHPGSSLAEVAHPPIDAILLRSVKGDQKKKKDGVTYPVGLGFHWSKFCKLRYHESLNYLRAVNGDEPFWAIEYFWKAGG